MSKDIRSFFLPKGKKIEQTSKETVSTKKNKKRLIVIDSDSDEPEEIFPKKKNIESDKNTSCKKQAEKLKPVNVSNIFGNEKVKRSAPLKTAAVDKNASKSSSKGSSKEFEEIHSDEDFEATLLQIDKIEEAALNNKQDINCEISIHSPNTSANNRKELENSKKRSHEKIKKKHDVIDLADNKAGGHKHIIEASEISVKKETPKKNPVTLDASISSPMDPAEKKRQQSLNYMKYLQRGGPKHLGSKEVPKGKPGCLSSLVFVITGVLDSLEREQAQHLIEEYGGKVTSNVSKHTSYLVYGDEAGNAKMKKATSFGTPLIDEDGLFKLITSKSEDTQLPDKGRPQPHKVSHKRERDGQAAGRKEDTPKKRKLEIKSEETNVMESSKIKDNGDLKESLPVTFKQKVETRLEKKEHVAASSTVSSCDTMHSNEKSPKAPVNYGNVGSSLWVDKYRPTKTKQIIGQQGDRSALRKLTAWLQNWHKNHSGNKKHVKPSPWAKNDDGSFFKTALLSGPPGIGKTTMAHLVSKELGFDVVEFNASDTRSKKLLHMEISELLSSKTLFGYVHPGSQEQQASVKHVLLMDEVDGMAGNEDRGGVQELIQLIKNTRVPIICMCNDRNHPKIRSLANYCFDLRVMKPRLEQIRGSMMSVCYKEGLKVPADSLTDIIVGCNLDIRQILHHLSLWSSKEKQISGDKMKKPKKDMKIGPWDVVKKVFSVDDHKTMSIHDKSDLFFHDYNISPLFVQENYLSVLPAAAKGSTAKTLDCIAQAAESISDGDVVQKCIRSRGSWSLLPVQAMFSSVIPGDVMEGYMRGQINFPAWLGKNSRTGKLDRLLQELHVHTRLSTSGSKQALNMEYLPHIRDAIIHPLVEHGSDGVPTTLNVLQSYNLLREDLESILELTAWPNHKDPMSEVDSRVKAALTRAYNKEGILTPYSVVNVVKKRSAGVSSEDYEDAEDEENEEDADDMKTDGMIKAKKALKTSSELSSKAPRGRGKGAEDKTSRGSQKRGRGRVKC